ncbi:MAG: alpha/beta hydrolase [Williamsia herbipolensis]|nr:alpha/beta hydrolase [Williamsia herbipolensis]
MTATPWPMPEPPDREHIADASDARSSDADLPAAPGVTAAAVPGRLLMVDDRGVFVRGPHRPPVAPDREQDGTDMPVALYVHGLAGNSTNFDVVGAVLAQQCRSYAIDLPGFGRSDPPPGERYGLEDDAAVVAAVIRELSPGRRVHLVGNSLGGLVCVLLAARHPELVASLSLISPAVPDLRMTTDRGADPRLALLLAPGTTAPAVRRLAGIDALQRAAGMAALCYGDPGRLSDADIGAAAVELGWRFPLRWVHTSTIRSVRSLMRSYLHWGGTSFRSLAGTVAVPVLVIWGTRDRLVDCGLAPATAAAFPNGRLLVLRDCGHVAQMERPEPTARAMLALWEDADAAAGASRLRGVPGVAPSTA